MKGLGKPLNLLRAALALVGLGSLRSAYAERQDRVVGSLASAPRARSPSSYHKIGNHRYRKSPFNERLLASMRRSAEMPQRRFHSLSSKKPPVAR